MRKSLILAGFMTAILLPGVASAQMMWGRGGGWSMMGGFGIFGIILSIIFWVFVIWAIVALIRWGMWSGHGGKTRWHGEDSAIQILKERYAKGEIKKEEFDEKMKDLAK
jgi:putative membrane protein